jgi:hypothetical protein
MIPKGLKVGDTYLEGKLVYKVTKVVSDSVYEATWTGAFSSKTAPAEQPKEEVKVEKKDEDYLSMPYATLKKLCAERGLDATGKKDELIARLEG